MDTAGLRRRHLVVVVLAMVGLLVWVGSAAAARTLEGEISETEPGEALDSPTGLAVDSTDRLWVTDRILVPGARVHRFSPAGSWEAQTASRPWGNHHMLESIAFDEAADRVFVSDSNSASLWGLDPADASYAGVELSPLGTATATHIRVAADNSGGLVDGALYVFSGDGRIIRIDSAGNPIDYTEGSSAGTNELSGADTPLGSFAGPGDILGAGIAVDAVGHLWVADTRPFDGFPEVVHKFAPSGKYLATITHAGAQALQSVSAVAIDPTTGNVLVSEIATNRIHEFTSAGAFVESTSIGTGAPLGLGVDSTGKLYVAGAFGPEPGEKVIDVYGAAGPAADRHTLEIEVTGAGEVIGAGIACTEAGNGTAACEEEFVEGSEVPLVANAATGHGFAAWSVVEGNPGGCTGATATCETGALAEATKLEAVFVETHNLDVDIAGSGSGEVNSSPAGISACGTPAGTCQATFNSGTAVTLAATATPGSTFTGWSGGGCSGTATCQVSVDADTEVTANFSEIPPPPPPIPTHTLTVQPVGEGQGSVRDNTGAISCPPTCSHSYGTRTPLMLVANPESGSRFMGWSVSEGSGSSVAPGGDCAGTGACHLTIRADTTLTARFARILPLSARLRINRVRARVARAKVRIVAAGTILRRARGAVRVRVVTRLRGRRVIATKRARIRNGRWQTRLALPWAKRRPKAKLHVSARFGGSPDVRSGNAKRRVIVR